VEKRSQTTLTVVLVVMAVTLVLGGVGLFWVAWKGVEMLKRQAAHVATVAMGDATVLIGKTDYIGTWEGGGVTLKIDSTGHVDYEKKEPGSSEALHGSLSFDGGDMVVDVLVMKRHLHIDTPPHLDGTRWVMKIDGEEIERR
jgi:hypothetical protein